MSTDRDLTPLVRAWLQERSADGFDPSALLQDVFEKRPTTPQRRRWWPFRWFPVGIGAMRRTGSEGPRSQGRSTTMFTATRIAAAVAIAAAASLALVAGPLGPASDPVFVPAAEAPSPSPSTDPAVRVEGWSQVTLDEQGVVDSSGPVGYLRGQKLRTRDAMSDPRVSGVGHVVIDADDYGGDIGPEWGTFRLENDEGAWQGSVSGFHSSVDSHVAGWLQGEGAYTGLSYYYEIVLDHSGYNSAVVTGIIYPGDPPPSE